MAKSKWLQEVEDDATRITQKRFDDYFAEQQYQKAKNEAKVSKPVQAVVEEAPAEVSAQKGTK